MILSVSRRTDIPAFYSDWFYNRVKDGYVLVRNPWYTDAHKVGKILINPEVCDCIVFWTKNPAPMLARLNEIKDYPYYFHFTLNSYNQSLECRVPKKKQIVETFKQLSGKIGSHRVIWRYDPIFLTPEIDIDYHIKYFEWIAKHLAGYTDLCKICPITMHKKNETKHEAHFYEGIGCGNDLVACQIAGGNCENIQYRSPILHYAMRFRQFRNKTREMYWWSFDWENRGV